MPSVRGPLALVAPALLVETGEAREVHHFCVLLGYGADAVCPYLTMEAIHKIGREGL